MRIDLLRREQIWRSLVSSAVAAFGLVSAHASAQPADTLQAPNTPPFAYMGPKGGPTVGAQWAELPTRSQVKEAYAAVPLGVFGDYHCVIGADGGLKDCAAQQLPPNMVPQTLDAAPIRALLPSFRVVKTTVDGVATEGFLVHISIHPTPDGSLFPIAIIMNPKFTRTPTAAEMAPLYPRKALRAGLTGHATMRCRVAEDGGLSGCEVSEETPQGEGFGEATLALARFFKMDRPGSQVNIPVNWKTSR